MLNKLGYPLGLPANLKFREKIEFFNVIYVPLIYKTKSGNNVHYLNVYECCCYNA